MYLKDLVRLLHTLTSEQHLARATHECASVNMLLSSCLLEEQSRKTGIQKGGRRKEG